MYLGKSAGILTIFISVIQAIFVLAIYLILSKSFSGIVWPAGASFHGLVIFWALASAAIFLNLKKFSLLESVIVVGITAIIIALFALGAGNLAAAVSGGIVPDWHYIFLPLGTVLFALYGRSGIPALVRLTGKRNTAIAFAIVAATVLYALFVLAVLSLSPIVAVDAISGLRGFIPNWAFFGIGALGLLSLFSSYISIGQDVFESLRLDFAIPVWTRFLIVIFGPMALYLAGFNNFISLVGFVGGVLLALEGIFIVLMWHQAETKKFGIGSILLIVVFAVAIISTVLK